MYTVLRFVADPTCSDTVLCELGQRLNGIRGFVFGGLDARGHRFSIRHFFRRAVDHPLIRTAEFRAERSFSDLGRETAGITVEADVAIEPEDVQEKFYLSCTFPAAALKELAQNAVDLTFTVYPGSSLTEG